MYKNILSVLCLLVFFTTATAQDTLRYRHSFKLPTGDNQAGYERSITLHNPANVHSFVFTVGDSVGMVYIVARSEYDSLHILLEGPGQDGIPFQKQIRLKARKDKLYEYGYAGPLPAGTNTITVRTRKTAAWKVYVKGQK